MQIQYRLELIGSVFHHLQSRGYQHICLPELGYDLRSTATILHEYNLLSWVLIIHQIIRLYSHYNWISFWGVFQPTDSQFVGPVLAQLIASMPMYSFCTVEVSSRVFLPRMSESFSQPLCYGQQIDCLAECRIHIGINIICEFWA